MLSVVVGVELPILTTWDLLVRMSMINDLYVAHKDVQPQIFKFLGEFGGDVGVKYEQTTFLHGCTFFLDVCEQCHCYSNGIGHRSVAVLHISNQ